MIICLLNWTLRKDMWLPGTQRQCSCGVLIHDCRRFPQGRVGPLSPLLQHVLLTGTSTWCVPPLSNSDCPPCPLGISSYTFAFVFQQLAHIQESAYPVLEDRIMPGFPSYRLTMLSPWASTSLDDSGFCLVGHKTRLESVHRGLELPP